MFVVSVTLRTRANEELAVMRGSKLEKCALKQADAVSCGDPTPVFRSRGVASADQPHCKRVDGRDDRNILQF